VDVEGRVPGAGDEELGLRRVNKGGSRRGVRGENVLISCLEVDPEGTLGLLVVGREKHTFARPSPGRSCTRRCRRGRSKRRGLVLYIQICEELDLVLQYRKGRRSYPTKMRAASLVTAARISPLK
jgi:hypothetical protein